MSGILITGARSVVGRYLLPIFDVRNQQVLAISRHPVATRGAVTWLRWDVNEECPHSVIREATVMIHLAPLPLLIPLLLRGTLVNLRRVVAIGTTSVFTKSDSNSARERTDMLRQRQAEQNLEQAGVVSRIRWTLFRPTLVYDGMHDKNVARISRLIRRLHFFPLPVPASGLRQPLHAADLAWSCVTVLNRPVTEFQTYNLAGGEVLSYRQMLERIFLASGQQPHILPVPRRVYRGMIRVMSLHPRYRYLTAEMADRMNQDMLFDTAPAQRDFGFSPRPFQPKYTNDNTRGAVDAVR